MAPAARRSRRGVGWLPVCVCVASVLLSPVSADYDLIPAGSVWKYDDTGTDLGNAWFDPSFDDSGWSQGAGPLGYGDGGQSLSLSPLSVHVWEWECVCVCVWGGAVSCSQGVLWKERRRCTPHSFCRFLFLNLWGFVCRLLRFFVKCV